MNDSPKRNSNSSAKYNSSSGNSSGGRGRRKNYNPRRRNNQSNQDGSDKERKEGKEGRKEGRKEGERSHSGEDSRPNRRPQNRRNDRGRGYQRSENSNRDQQSRDQQSKDGRRRREDPRRKKRYNYKNKKHNDRGNNRGQRNKGNQVHKDLSKGPLTPRKIPMQYEYLLNEYLKHRKNYFNKFHTSDKKHMRSLQNKFWQATERLRKFESSMKEEWQKESLKKHLHEYPVDTDFSDNHNEPFTPEPVDPKLVLVDIHFENIKPEKEVVEIDEESSGTMDDYYAYKGQHPTEKKHKEI